MARERVVDVYIPVVSPSVGIAAVGPMLVAPIVVAVFAVLVAVAVCVSHPAPHHRYYDRPCDPFCSTTTVSAPSAQFPFGGEQR